MNLSPSTNSERLIAWDFDGVLNDNVRDGRFIWADDFEEVTGQSLDVFKDMVFGKDFRPVMTGKEDLRDRVSAWADAVGYAPGADALIEYWFASDFHPNSEVLRLVDHLRAAGVRQVMATNNEWRRTALITEHQEFGPRMDHIFAAGPMGVCKPMPGFFEKICAELGTAPEQMILVDDVAENIEAAHRFGWQAYHFTDATRDGLHPFLSTATEAAL